MFSSGGRRAFNEVDVAAAGNVTHGRDIALPSGHNPGRGRRCEVTGMQYIEASVIGIRSAVITLKRRATPLRFVLLPMVHVAEPDFYREVAALAGECALIVAEGVPSRYFPMQALMSRIRRDHLVDQTAALDLESLGVPVRWEVVMDDRPKSGLEQAKARATDAASAVLLRAMGRY